jgi:DNA polymerase-1
VQLLDEAREAELARGSLLALTVTPTGDISVVSEDGWSTSIDGAEAVTMVAEVDRELRPRWAVWSIATAAALAERGVRIATCWDVAAVHRLLFGGWRADPGRAWAAVHDLPLDTVPSVGPVDLFSVSADEFDDPDEPVRDDGHLRPDWVAGDWAGSPERREAWAYLALEVIAAQTDLLARSGEPARAESTARSESVAELLCAELAADGLPMDRSEAERIIAELVGPRPRSEADAVAERARRDAVVLAHVPPGMTFDLRNPAQVKSLLRSVGVEVPDTRAWRLDSMRDAHPLVAALLDWRKAERIDTTFGYRWIDEHLGADGRLRGDWSGSDGAAGRMTASAGLHNMPALMRPAVRAERGHVFVRADLGQIEPRVLAAVSGDQALARAAQEDDMYAPVAAALGVDRATAKVAVLGAMYGQTTGHGAAALRRLDAAYPVAMAYLQEADLSGQSGRDLRTFGGRLIRMGEGNTDDVDERDARSRAAARGRFGRNAMVQGAAAELFKVWALTVRARGAAIDARIVLCLHDELLVQVPAQHAAAGERLLHDCLQEAAHRWLPGSPVRFIADVSAVERWSDAKS